LFSDAFYLNAQAKQRLNSKEFEMSTFKVFLVVSTAFLIVSCGSSTSTSTSTSAAASAALPSRIAVL
jgi:hypothetical protein